ncbi:hypothetical protein [uncultured Pelagimonas sp.]|uniref:hypothetical protein n=1 Tax=uncultured Pelagimonas sp. TaxID=1618102 RepID=UPI0026331D55|nr:hypothetical protein [uncultured Pelagimonas sp.]
MAAALVQTEMPFAQYFGAVRISALAGVMTQKRANVRTNYLHIDHLKSCDRFDLLGG